MRCEVGSMPLNADASSETIRACRQSGASAFGVEARSRAQHAWAVPQHPPTQPLPFSGRGVSLAAKASSTMGAGASVPSRSAGGSAISTLTACGICAWPAWASATAGASKNTIMPTMIANNPLRCLRFCICFSVYHIRLGFVEYRFEYAQFQLRFTLNLPVIGRSSAFREK